ncbi:hypothetical protein GCM10011613_21740 [Cellvibrio zantedeschiae]|uniref:Uncharacterized protein n=1 Tax=Cellvibrio zantedeschiae TaxID=1237077 RepID=A0ABQ3B303_9GAMM|nr:hypothetical protein [Cellvibrio zantedeschiae]GGY76876.1 hypothetical protein GCM10011613_21740 [Cellvibrio zantedeschiae]
MKLELSGTELTQQPDEAIIISSLNTLKSDDDSFLILSKDTMGYMQTCKASDGTYVLEYRESTEEEGHYECADEALSFQKVLSAFISYLHETDEWKTSLKWQPLGYSNESGGRSVGLLVFAVVALLVVITTCIYAYK